MEEQIKRLNMLLTDVVALRKSVAAARTVYGGFRHQIERPGFAASALNLAHYLALRRQDLRRMQRQLMIFGLSTLGRSEGHVMATLDSVVRALSSMTGQARVRSASDRPFLRGEERLRMSTAELFGPPGSVRAIRPNRLFPLHPLSDGHKYTFCKEKSLAARFAGDQPGVIKLSRPV